MWTRLGFSTQKSSRDLCTAHRVIIMNRTMYSEPLVKFNPFLTVRVFACKQPRVRVDSSTVILTSGSPQAVRHVWKKVKNLRRSCLSTISVQSVTTDGVTVLQAAKEVCVVFYSTGKRIQCVKEVCV